MWKRPPLYSVWSSMRDRCRNPRFRQWNDYGGRGITICERWDDFRNFVADMGPRPPGTRLERKDNNGPYSPENCCWATPKEQQRNQRVTRKVVIEGISYVAADLSDASGLKTDTIIKRASLGLSLNEVLYKGRRVFTDGLALGGAANGFRLRSREKCKNGHLFTKTNTYLTKEGWRRCKRCRADRQLIYSRR